MEFKPKIGETWEWTMPDIGRKFRWEIQNVSEDGTTANSGHLISEEEYTKRFGKAGSWRRVYDDDDFTNWALEVRENANAEKVSSGG